jgi:hypothetical protein
MGSKGSEQGTSEPSETLGEDDPAADFAAVELLSQVVELAALKGVFVSDDELDETRQAIARLKALCADWHGGQMHQLLGEAPAGTA